MFVSKWRFLEAYNSFVKFIRWSLRVCFQKSSFLFYNQENCIPLLFLIRWTEHIYCVSNLVNCTYLLCFECFIINEQLASTVALIKGNAYIHGVSNWVNWSSLLCFSSCELCSFIVSSKIIKWTAYLNCIYNIFLFFSSSYILEGKDWKLQCHLYLQSSGFHSFRKIYKP